MIELFEQDILLNDRQSSKGNQLKWQSQNGIWYKADYTGYEGLVEYLVSCLLGYSSLKKTNMFFTRQKKSTINTRIILGVKVKIFCRMAGR